MFSYAPKLVLCMISVRRPSLGIVDIQLGSFPPLIVFRDYCCLSGSLRIFQHVIARAPWKS